MKRKIIQISARGGAYPGVYALADDGTLWLRSAGIWGQIEGLPQPVSSDAVAEPQAPDSGSDTVAASLKDY